MCVIFTFSLIIPTSFQINVSSQIAYTRTTNMFVSNFFTCQNDVNQKNKN